MVDAGRRRRRLAPLALGLALWSGLPSFEWCPFTWEDCWKACEAAVAERACATGMAGPACVAMRGAAAETCAPAEACDPAKACGSAAVCGSAAARASADACAPAGACDAASVLRVLPCDRDPDPVPFGDRVWCIHAPIEGVPVRGLELPPVDAGPVLFDVAETPRLPLPAGAGRERVEVASACPALHAPHAPPQCRAPPCA